MMKRDVFISIKRKYVDLILKGEKNIELRKRVPKHYDRHKYYVVCEGKMRLIFYSAALYMPVEDVFKNPEWKPGITLEELKAYAGTHVYVLTIKSPMIPVNEPLDIDHFGLRRAPQNYCFSPKIPYRD